MKKAKNKTKSIRKQGGQPGHKGKNRKLLPAEEMDKIHDIYPRALRILPKPFFRNPYQPFRQAGTAPGF